MFGFGKRSRTGTEQPPAAAAAPDTPAESASTGFFSRLKAGLSRTRDSLAQSLGNLLLGKKAIDQDLLDELETRLLTSDVGVKATAAILSELSERVKRKELADSEALYVALKGILQTMLQPCEAPLQIPKALGKPFVILMVGVNGVGKTTTIGKLAKRFQGEGHSVMLAAGDTFRAAAVEQLQIWGDRNNVPVVAQHTGADSASVIFDAYQSASAKKVDVLIADTAGRLHNKNNLMQELEKVVRVLKKLDPDVPHETLLVLDATTGQNALSQARSFTESVKVSGLVLSKLDGTARGGMVFAIAKELGLPLRFIGVGEKAEDLRPFMAAEFVQALFSTGIEQHET
jgi:fused signal recognition particle receptor